MDPLEEAQALAAKQDEWGRSISDQAVALLLQAVVALTARVEALEKKPKPPK